MNTLAITAGFLFASHLPLTPLLAEEPRPVEKTAPAPGNAAVDWGKAEDPDGDCKITAKDQQLVIKVPGGLNSHDLSAELGKMNSPRSLQEIDGDFTIRVTVDGGFDPGGDSAQEGRSGYNGACLLLMMDDKNYLRLERATLHWKGQEPKPYINYELREAGSIASFGSTGDTAFKPEGPTVLRLERKGNTIVASVSNDGLIFVNMAPKTLPPNWPAKLRIGVAAVSTSQQDFTPVFSQLMIDKSTKPAKPATPPTPDPK